MINGLPVRLEWVLAPLLVVLAGHAGAAEIHQHGMAKAAVVIDAGEVTVSFRAPLMDILGTEAAPVDAPARKRYADRLNRITAPELSPAAQCERVKATLSTVDTLFPLAQPVDDHDHDHEHDQASHQDVDNEWVFSCAAPEKLARVSLPFLKIFSGLTTEVILLLPTGQSALRLAPGETRIPLE